MSAGARHRRLRRPTEPIPDESARGLVCRALGDHHVPRTWNVLRLVGLQHRNRVSVAEDEELDIDGLARIIRVDPAELRQRRYRALPNGRRDFFGLSIHGAGIEDRIRRFSPKGIGLSPHARALWELRDLPFCPEGWDMLVDACTCSTVQRFVRLNRVHRCDDCGRELARVPSTSVPARLQDALSFIAGLVHPVESERAEALARLPEPVRAAGRSAVWRAVMRLRRAVAGPAPNAATDLEALAGACRAVLAWPLGIHDLRTGRGTTAHAWSSVQRLYEGLGPVVTEASDRMGRASPQGPAPAPNRRVPTRRTQVHNGLVGLYPASDLAQVRVETLLRAREDGRLTRHERSFGERAMPLFDPAEVVAFGESLRLSSTAGRVGDRWGVGSWAVEDLHLGGLLPATEFSRSVGAASFRQSDVLRFERTIEGAARPSIEGGVPVHRALLAFHGGPKPWAGIVRGMIDGSLPFALTQEAGRLFERVRFAPDFAALLSEACPRSSVSPARHVVKQQALEILNSRFRSDGLAQLPSTGSNPVVYDMKDVLRLAKRAISSAEFGWRRSRASRNVHTLLARHGVNRIASDLWSRPQVEDLLRTGAV